MKNAEITILAISSSLATKSRSRTMARIALDGLTRFDGVRGRWIDLAEFDLRSYPRSEDDPIVAWMREEFEAADGLIVACPVYNWGAAGSALNFLHYVLDSENGRRHRPFIILGGAGTVRSHLALDGVARSLLNEIQGIQIGPPILGAGTEVDHAGATLAPTLADRIEKTTAMLVTHAAVSLRQLEQSVA